MVVMLIMSIILAAMAPVMTTRARKMEEDRLSSTIWQWADNDTDIYFGYNPDELDVSNTQKVMIGQNGALANDLARLIINTSDDLPYHIILNKDNTFLGRLFIKDNNVIFGDSEGGGADAVAIGKGALLHDNGEYNTAVGTDALKENTTGSYNTAVGYKSLEKNTEGEDNSALGVFALSTNTTGNENTAVGQFSLQANTEGSYNTGVGKGTLGANTTGDYNTAVGSQSLRYNVEGSENVAIGYKALNQAENLDNNVAIGVNSLSKLTSGNSNTSIGSNNMANLEVGSNNTSVGFGAMELITDTAVNTAIGVNALRGTGVSGSSRPLSNIAIGFRAMENGNSSNNLAIGNSSLANYSGYGYNVMLGNSSGYNLNSGMMNIGIGPSALSKLKSGSYNVSIGANSFSNLEEGDSNISIGAYACSNVTGSNKICIGHNSGPAAGSDWASDAEERIFIGSQSKFNNAPAVLEIHNSNATSHNISKSRSAPDTAVVINGMLVVKGGIIATIPELGGNAHEATGGADAALLGHDSGSSSVRTANNSNSNRYADYFAGYGGFINPGAGGAIILSDRRLKYVGKEFTSGLDKIRQLKVFNYTFKKDEKKTPHVGVIAQDLQKVFPDAVKKGADGFLQIRFEDMFYAVINAIKELDAKVAAQDKKIKELEARIERLEALVK